MNVDDIAVKKMEKLLEVIAEAEKFGAENEELSVEDLDKVTGGVSIPNFQQFLQYARDRSKKESENR